MSRPDPNSPIQLTFELDGQTIEATARAGRSALDFLRQDCRQSQLVPGCSPQGLCGCCAVLVNGKPKLSCTLRVKNLNGKTIQTLKSIPTPQLHRLHAAFAVHGAAQCGYCTPGILLQSAALLEQNPEASDLDIDKALNMHLCRCTGYAKIKKAIQSVQNDALQSGTGFLSPESSLACLGQSLRVADICYPSTQYAVPVFSSHLGQVTSIESELEQAAFVSLRDLFSSVEDPFLTHAGMPVGFTLASSLDIARENSLRVKASVTPIVPNLSFEALKPPIQKAHRAESKHPSKVQQWLTQSVETPMQEPAYLEPDALICTPTATGLHLTVAGVNPHRLKSWLHAHDIHNVEIESLACGASYGGRNVDFLALCAIKLCQRTQEPIAIQLTFEQAQRMHPKAPPQKVSLKLGLDQTGAPCALQGHIHILGGTTPPEHLANDLAQSIQFPYAIEHIDIQIATHPSDHPPTTWLRDKGLTAFSIALENLMNQAAKLTGHDPLSYRAKHLKEHRYYDLLKAAASYASKHKPDSFALALITSTPAAEAHIDIKLTVTSGTGIEILLPFPDNGQGLESLLMAQAAQATGFSFDIFSCRSNTTQALSAHCHAEDLMVLAPIALQKACEALLKDLEDRSIEALDGQIWTGEALGSEARPQAAAVLCTVDSDEQPQILAVSSIQRPNSGVEGLIEGAAHMGFSMALGESLRFDAQGIPLAHLRHLNLLKAKNSPSILSQLLVTRDAFGAGVAQVAATAATCALAAPDADALTLPLADSALAQRIGIRVR